MKNYSWIESIDGKQYITPVIIQNDCEYLPELRKKLNAFSTDLKLSGIDNSIAIEIERYSKRVIVKWFPCQDHGLRKMREHWQR